MKRLALLACCLLLCGIAPGSAAAERADDAPTRYVEVGGTRIAYRALGSGPPLVLLTRFRGTLDTWDPLFLEQLSRTHRVITLDYPGVGYSSGAVPADVGQVAALVHAFAAQLGVSRYAVLGWSWGGIVAQTLLLQHPEAVSHAVLVGTAPPGPGQAAIHPVWLERALKPVNDIADEEILFFEPASEASRRAARSSHDRIYARPEVARRIPSSAAQFQPFFVMADAFKKDAAGRRDLLTKSPVPMLILCGDNDPSVPATNWYPLIGRIPKGQITVLPQSGHGPQHQYPHLSAQYIAAFMRDGS
jgi:pimeloyl-ACP methyl ester carboxylesterase